MSIVIPFYNEEQNIFPMLQQVDFVLSRIPGRHEIIAVDDGSKDNTFAKLCEAQKNIQTVKIVKFRRNFGQTPAMQAGFDYARGEVIISMDGDLQNDPEDIPRLLQKLDEGYDVVCGWRKDRKDKALTRILPSKVANWLIGKITGVFIHDNGCSLKAYRSSVIKSVKLYSDMHRFIPAMTTIVGARIAEIVVNHRARKFGEAKYGLSRIWKVMSDMITIKMLIHFHHQPIMWFAKLGLIFLFFGLGLGIASIVHFLQGEQSIVFPASSFLLFFLFISLLFWGLLAEFFVKIERKTAHRPQFVDDLKE